MPRSEIRLDSLSYQVHFDLAAKARRKRSPTLYTEHRYQSRILPACFCKLSTVGDHQCKCGFIFIGRSVAKCGRGLIRLSKGSVPAFRSGPPEQPNFWGGSSYGSLVPCSLLTHV